VEEITWSFWNKTLYEWDSETLLLKKSGLFSVQHQTLTNYSSCSEDTCQYHTSSGKIENTCISGGRIVAFRTIRGVGNRVVIWRGVGEKNWCWRWRLLPTIHLGIAETGHIRKDLWFPKRK
jgi:hypothetical protein